MLTSLALLVSSLASRLGCSLQDLEKSNPAIKDPNELSIGEKVVSVSMVGVNSICEKVLINYGSSWLLNAEC
jgi:hypothetical protein